MVNVAIRNERDIPMELAQVSSEVDYARGETLRIVSGPETVRLIIDSKNLDKLTKPQSRFAGILSEGS